jgi:hypothetical protein
MTHGLGMALFGLRKYRAIDLPTESSGGKDCIAFLSTWKFSMRTRNDYRVFSYMTLLCKLLFVIVHHKWQHSLILFPLTIEIMKSNF